MASLNVWFVRHCQGGHNVNNDFSLPDPELTPAGRLQASSISQNPLLKGVFDASHSLKIDTILTSPLTRCLQTGLEAFESHLHESCKNQRTETEYTVDTKKLLEINRAVKSVVNETSDFESDESGGEQKREPKTRRNHIVTSDPGGHLEPIVMRPLAFLQESYAGNRPCDTGKPKSVLQATLHTDDFPFMDFSELSEKWFDVDPSIFETEEKREAAIRLRLGKFVKYLSNLKEKNIVVIAHKGILRRMLPKPKHEIFSTAEVRLFRFDFSNYTNLEDHEWPGMVPLPEDLCYQVHSVEQLKEIEQNEV